MQMNKFLKIIKKRLDNHKNSNNNCPKINEVIFELDELVNIAETQINKSNNGWISVDYELPKQEQIVRAYNPRWREKYNHMTFIFLNGNFITYPYMYKVVQPTHWQPFSLLPKE